MKALIVFSLVLLAAAASVRAGKLAAGNEPVGLYDANDKMELLSNLTFRAAVYEKQKIWLVEFYNSWCGFCQRFAPVWKEFAAGVHPWNEIVTIGVVDCASPDNNPLCRDLEVMSYPTLRVYPLMSKVGDLGQELVAEKTVSSIKSALLDYVEKEQLEGRGNQEWPTLIPYRNSEITNIWARVPDAVQNMILIFEEAGSTMGREVILDFGKVRNIRVRRVTTNNEALAKLLEVSNYPSLAVLKRDLSVVHLIPASKSREGYAASVHAFLSQEGVIEDVAAFRDIPRESRPEQAQNQIEGAVLDPPDAVYRADLENTLRYSLKHEVAMHKVIAGETLEALKMYLRTMASFFPTKPQGTMFLERLRDWVEAAGESIRGEDFLVQVNTLERTFNFVIPENQEWIGCRGSSSKYRGYTCGLWTTFHALTVGAATQTKRRVTPGSELVLHSILMYVRHFFGCADCSKHFQTMAAARHLEAVRGLDDAVLWLWEAHNVVNKRLHGDKTEDPAHPKMQFPSAESCSACSAGDGQWYRPQVLAYLKARYGKTGVCNNLQQCKPVNLGGVSLRHGDKLISPEIDMPKTETAADFSYFDIGLCVLLYLASAVVLVLSYYKFIYRRRHRTKFNIN
ncbi:Hypothetical predicted protein [Cloeon dipterum]|uniref:Sulfhydryl oxidase n=1 Tax=Cloeon dipterum TaxID=197152 RepID=A0A8S1D1X8_9INSE|nr:Hypothetical predicted protein [Cloeon dipterum]